MLSFKIKWLIAGDQMFEFFKGKYKKPIGIILFKIHSSCLGYLKIPKYISENKSEKSDKLIRMWRIFEYLFGIILYLVCKWSET